ncbi:MAG: hypothetical protein M0R73_09930 [Dehalococcoidia bacterium]|nr:hypothetical protein [Dehalococcoidia bacterium]
MDRGSHRDGSHPEDWLAPPGREPLGRGMGTRSALVLITDPRAAVAATLVLQEMGHTVDLGSEPAYALRWLRRARYDVVLAGGAGVATPRFAARLREAAPDARILLMAERTLADDDLGDAGIEVLRLPMDVNALVARFMPAAA